MGKIVVSPSTVTCRSPIASRRAECVRGEARLISSARTISLKSFLSEFETSTHGIVNIDPDDIGGNEVGSELNTFETAAERFGEYGLAGARNTFDKRVPAAQRAINAHSIASRFPTTTLHVIAHALGKRLDGERRCVRLEV